MVYKGIIGVVVAVSLVATGTVVLVQSGSQSIRHKRNKRLNRNGPDTSLEWLNTAMP
jgi:hypothetical protein